MADRIGKVVKGLQTSNASWHSIHSGQTVDEAISGYDTLVQNIAELNSWVQALDELTTQLKNQLSLKYDKIGGPIGEKGVQITGGTSPNNSKLTVRFIDGVSAESDALTYEDIVNMEATLEGANVSGEIKYIVSPTAKATLKTTKIDAGSGKFAMEGNEMNGYPVLCTSAVSGKGVIMGNFNDLVIGQWGGIDLTVDTYTQAANGKVRLVINAYFDCKPRRAEAFVKKVLA